VPIYSPFVTAETGPSARIDSASGVPNRCGISGIQDAGSGARWGGSMEQVEMGNGTRLSLYGWHGQPRLISRSVRCIIHVLAAGVSGGETSIQSRP
jgi:hypothetical protein